MYFLTNENTRYTNCRKWKKSPESDQKRYQTVFHYFSHFFAILISLTSNCSLLNKNFTKSIHSEITHTFRHGDCMCFRNNRKGTVSILVIQFDQTIQKCIIDLENLKITKILNRLPVNLVIRNTSRKIACYK